MADYTHWPTASDILAKVKGIGFTLATDMDASYISEIRASVVAEIEKECRRTFEPVTEIRYFDGNGRGELEIDEYIDVTAVDILGFFGSAAGMALTDWWEPQRNKYPKNRIQIYQGSQPSLTRIYVGSFPRGRGNIKVTANWGYGATIPANLWEAVKDYSACILAAEKMYADGSGFKSMWKEADVAEQLIMLDPKRFLPHMARVKTAIKQYKVPTGRLIRFFSTKTIK